jgi:valine--pyruvate aminotransferase
MRPLIEHGDITRLVQEDVQPYYLGRVAKAHDLIRAHFPDELPWRLHTWQGTFFFWLWLEGARVIGRELHDDLRSLGVITVPGSSFFPGSQDASWRHPQECLRLDIARPDAELEAGIAIMGKAMRKAY